jgi:4'-phosphopantetheinyl transferase
MEKITSRLFSAAEKAIFCTLPESKKKESFFHCWTRKEAILKATGYGLYQPLNTFDVTLPQGEPVKLLNVEECQNQVSKWYVRDLYPAHDYAAACAVGSPPRLC